MNDFAAPLPISPGLARLIVESSTDVAIVTTDLDGLVTSWNPGAEQIMGWARSDMAGRNIATIFTPEDRAQARPELEREAALASGRAEDMRWHLREDGTRFWGSGMTMPLRDGELQGFLKILRDTTDHLHAEQGRARRLEQMKALAEAARVIVGAPDLPTTLRAITDAARDIVGAHQAVCSLTRGADWSQSVDAVSLSDKYGAWRDYAAATDGTGIYAWVCEGSRTLRMTQAQLQAHPLWRGFGAHADAHPPMRGWLATAIVGTDGRNLGLIQLSDKYEGEFDEVDESIAVQLAQLAASAVERSQAEERSRTSEEFTRRILAASTDCIKVLDLEGGIEFMSDGGMLVMEVDEPAIVHGKVWPDLWDHGGADARAAMEIATGGGTARFRGSAPTAKGTPKWWDVVLVPMLGADGAADRLLAISRDVTDEYRSQAAIRESQARLQLERELLDAVIRQAPVGISITEAPSGRPIALNHKAIEITGHPELGDDVERYAFYGACHHDGQPYAIDDYPTVRSLKRGEIVEGEEILYRYGGRNGAGPWHRLQFSSAPVRDAGGRIVAAVTIIIDVEQQRQAEDEQKRTQEELHRLNETLENRVIEEVATRMRAEAALRQSQKLEALGQLTGGVAHDFNNLLTIIRSSADLLRRTSLSEERRQRYIEAISDTADRAAKLTAQLLAFARRQALKPEIFDVAERVEAVADMLRSIVGARIEVATDLACQACFVEADINQFETALVNLTANARDAMDGEGVLSIRLTDVQRVPETRGHGAASGNFVALSIADTGSGISADQLVQIFEPFFTTKEVGKGTGLGLSQVYGFVKQSGGEVTVDSTPGAGTTFTLYLPRANTAPARFGDERRNEGSAHGDGRVLVVEDNTAVGEFATQLLRDLGYEPTHAANADEALRLIEGDDAADFDIVFSDIVMPGVSGIELAKELRRRRPGLPIVLTSGYSQTLAQEGSHGFEVLHKPYSVEALSRVLRRALETA